MDEFEKQLTIARVREKDLVDYLLTLGFEPAKPSRNGVDFYYLSPLRIESEPSFHVNRKKNQWFDHGLKTGGNLIDFGMRFFGCTFGEFMDRLSANHASGQGIAKPEFDRNLLAQTESKITILNEKPLYSYPLVHYLHDRHIPLSVAMQFCSEVTYELDAKKYYGIGFKNDSGGFEIRNAYVKQSSAPKDITCINNGAKQTHVFEGFMDFLSFQTMHIGRPESATDFVILNGAAFFEKARPVMEQHEVISLWLDRDTTGRRYTEYAMSLNKGYRDESGLYGKHKDLNDWLCGKGIVERKRLKQGIG